MRWKIAKLGSIADINPRLSCKPAPKEKISFVPMAAVSEKSLAIESPVDRLYEEVTKGYRPFERGDILVAKITPCFENGKMAHAVHLPRAIGSGSTEFHVLRPKSSLDGAYLFHLLRHPSIRSVGARKMKGAAGQRRVSADFFSNLQIPLPLVGEQKRIAGILDAADALRVKRRESLAQLDALLKSTFLTLFGDPIENPMEWEMVPLSGLGQVITGNTPSRSRPEFFGNDIEWIKSDNINTPAFKLTTASEGLSIEGRKVARTAPPRSVLVTCIAGSKECIGNAAVTD